MPYIKVHKRGMCKDVDIYKEVGICKGVEAFVKV